MRNRDTIKKMMDKFDCTGDRITPDGIKERIVNIEFKTIELCGVKLMYCGIALKTNNPDRPFLVTGKPSVCIDEDNWREAIGQQVSYDNAFDEIYKLEAYRFMTEVKPVPSPRNLQDGFSRYESKPIFRDGYQLTKRDLVTMTYQTDHKATIQIAGKLVEFAYHCEQHEIQPGDYEVYLSDDDCYHCSEKVFKERNCID